jgi:hypothetical protein
MLNQPLAAHAGAKNDRLNRKTRAVAQPKCGTARSRAERETEQRGVEARQRGRK